MKRPGLLIASLGLNLALAAAAIAWRPAGPRTAPTPPPAAAVTPKAEAPSIEAPAVAPGATPTFQTNRFHWRRVESDDYRQYIANLRAIACPERLIRDILLADIETLYRRKHEALDLQPAGFEPWTAQRQRQKVWRGRRAQEQALAQQQRALIKELLGIEWNKESPTAWQDEGMVAVLLGYLPDEKVPQLMNLIEQSSEAGHEVRNEVEGILIDEDYSRLDGVRARMFAQLGELLTPAEFEETRLRAQLFKGLFGNELHVEGVALTGAEFRELTGLTRLVRDVLEEDLVASRPRKGAEEDEARREKQFLEQVAQRLGPERFAEYQYAQKSEFRDAYEFTQEHHLPKAAAARICDALTGALEQAEQIKTDATLSREEQTTALTVLQAATRTTVASTLGKAGAAYLETLESTFDDLARLPEPNRKGPP